MTFSARPRRPSVPTVADSEQGQITYASHFAGAARVRAAKVVLAVDRDLLRGGGAAHEPLEHLPRVAARGRRTTSPSASTSMPEREATRPDLAVGCRERAHETLGVGGCRTRR